MSSITFNTSSSASRSDRWQNLEAEAEMQASRIVSVFERSAPRSKPVNFFKAPHVNSHIISFLNTKQIASIIRLVNKQAKEATGDAIRIQLSAKTSLTFKEILGYQHSLGLADPAAVLHLCVNQKGESNLTHLNLSNSKIDETSLHRFAAQCLNLTSLNLSHCYQLTDDGLRALAAQCLNLTSLNLSHCYQLTDDGLRALAAELPNLTSLNLSGCHRLTDDGLRALAAQCPDLISLDLPYCNQLTDDGLRALAAGLPNLTSLNLAGRLQFTDDGLRALVLIPNLTSLNLSYCNRLTDKGLGALAAQCPRLHIIRNDLSFL